ncbi:hypothetical protein QQ020_24850 [Fulvivirgaceae bacterium BMA12]|uniref:Uncharacterized protein n=1 Tax=Agaribacillus aureus TaxID=3051825 RepID=A0ABT8LC49_9BACT|nr:hypothetical protein [Fulvivirgaceae bacterium BMA12]
MQNKRIIALIIIMLALFSFHNSQKRLFTLVRSKVESYQLRKHYNWLTRQKNQKNYRSHSIAPEMKDQQLAIIRFKLE